MPLEHSSSDTALHHNISTLMHEVGSSPHVKNRAQALAIAFDEQRRNRGIGGVVPNFQAGGGTDPVQAVISALQQGVNTGGLSAVPNTSNQSAPSSLQATAATNNPGVALPQTTSPSGITGTTNASVAPPQPLNPMAKQLMADGGVANRAIGGFNMMQNNPPWFVKQEARGLHNMHVGPVVGSSPGRADNRRVSVPSGSYILPSDHLSAIGHGNSMAGMSIAQQMFGAPYGGPSPRIGGHSMMPKPPRMLMSEGGARGETYGEPAPVNISDGEFVITPEAIIKKFGSLKRGHAILDKWILDTRKNHISTLRKLPPPAKK